VSPWDRRDPEIPSLTTQKKKRKKRREKHPARGVVAGEREEKAYFELMSMRND